MIPRTVLQRVLAHRRILHSEGVVAGAWLTMRGRTGGPRGGQAWVFRPLAVTHEKGAAKLVSAMDVAGPGARMMSSGAGGRVTFSRKHPEWNSMHQKLQAGDINGVLASFMKLKKEGVACLLVYNMVLAAHARVRAADDALDLFEEIEANADRLGGPDQHSVSALANALCRAGRLNAACDLVERMRAVGVAPNINVYNVLLSGTVLPRQVGVAQAILKKMAHDGIIGDEFTLIARIRLAARLGNAAEVTATWRDAVGGLISANMPCSRASISCLAVSYAKCSRPDLAEGALRVIVRLSAGDGGKVRGVLPAELYEAAGIEAPPCVAGDGEGGSGGEEVWKGQPTSLRECGGGSGGGPAGRETDAASEWGHDDYKKHILSAFNSTMAAYNKQGHVPGVRAVQEMLLSVGVPPELSTQNAHMRSDEAIQVVLGDDATTQEESALQRLEKWLANRVGSTQSTGRSKQHKDSMVCAINMAMIVAEKLNGVEGIMQLVSAMPCLGRNVAAQKSSYVSLQRTAVGCLTRGVCALSLAVASVWQARSAPGRDIVDHPDGGVRDAPRREWGLGCLQYHEKGGNNSARENVGVADCSTPQVKAIQEVGQRTRHGGHQRVEDGQRARKCQDWDGFDARFGTAGDGRRALQHL